LDKWPKDIIESIVQESLNIIRVLAFCNIYVYVSISVQIHMYTKHSLIDEKMPSQPQMLLCIRCDKET
jgi:hypothetical protein